MPNTVREITAEWRREDKQRRDRQRQFMALRWLLIAGAALVTDGTADTIRWWVVVGAAVLVLGSIWWRNHRRPHST